MRRAEERIFVSVMVVFDLVDGRWREEDSEVLEAGYYEDVAIDEASVVAVLPRKVVERRGNSC